MNEDAHASVIAQVDRHVPELVLLLLFSAFVVKAAIDRGSRSFPE